MPKPITVERNQSNDKSCGTMTQSTSKKKNEQSSICFFDFQVIFFFLCVWLGAQRYNTYARHNANYLIARCPAKSYETMWGNNNGFLDEFDALCGDSINF